MSKLSYSSPNAPTPVGPYSPAIIWENLVFISGQGPLEPQTMKPVGGDIRNQTLQVFKNIDSLLHECKAKRENILKISVYLSDLNDFAAMNDVYAEYFDGCVYPARTTIQASRLPLDMDVEIDVIAYLD